MSQNKNRTKKLSVDPRFSIFCCGEFSKIEFFFEKKSIFSKKFDFSKKCQNPPKWLFWHFFDMYKNLSKSCLRGLGVGKLVFWYKMPAYMLNFQKSQSHPWGSNCLVKVWICENLISQKNRKFSLNFNEISNFWVERGARRAPSETSSINRVAKN